jgi:Zn-dependent M28 family amino/carboxypeptidase
MRSRRCSRQQFTSPDYQYSMQKIIPTLIASLFATSVATSVAVAAAPKAVLPQVQEAPLRGHLAFLSSDLLEGRGTGQRGGELAVSYLENQAMAVGLKPANNGSYRQLVKIAGVKTDAAASTLRLEANGAALPISFGKDWVYAPGDAQAAHSFNSDLVFVGYGINASEEGWNDFKGQDLKGKILVMMVNDPQPTAEQPNRFGGKALTYYGRWTYKFEEAARQGAKGVLLIHTTESASYNYSVVQNSWAGVERFQLAQGTPGTELQGWITNETAQSLFKAAGQDLDALRKAAESKDFKPVPLNVKLAGDMKAEVRNVDQYNVAGVVPGTDPKLKAEVVIYSAHWDHLGKQGEGKDNIFNGAVDNASGTAALLAMAQAAVQAPAKRSQMFLWVAAEEQGLLGSSAYAEAPLWPLEKTAAALNLDSLNWIGVTRDIGTAGSERTDLRKLAEATAKSMQMVIAEEQPDLSGGYFRSDHFSFAKVGVPAFSVGAGRDYLGDKEAAKVKKEAYRKSYHQVSDEYDPAWNLAGMTQQAQFTLNLGRAVADAPGMPAWRAGDAFGKARLKP